MKDWINILIAFVKDDKQFDLGTRKIDEMKVMTPQGTIEVQEDDRWAELIKIGQIFAGQKV